MGRGGEHNSNQIAFHPKPQVEVTVSKIIGILTGNCGEGREREGLEEVVAGQTPSRRDWLCQREGSTVMKLQLRWSLPFTASSGPPHTCQGAAPHGCQSQVRQKTMERFPGQTCYPTRQSRCCITIQVNFTFFSHFICLLNWREVLSLFFSFIFSFFLKGRLCCQKYLQTTSLFLRRRNGLFILQLHLN